MATRVLLPGLLRQQVESIVSGADGLLPAGLSLP